MGRIVWLASYPKSGNTWVRAFLTNYLADGAAPASINALAGHIASDRHTFDEMTGVESSDLSADEAARYRPAAYRLLAAESEATTYLKVHDAVVRGSVPLIPADATAAAIYIVRNPLDVAVSLASHLDCGIARAVDHVCEGLTLAAGGAALRSQIEQAVLSWGAHVRSWLDDPGFRVECVRYEDLIDDAVGAFRRILVAAGEPVDDERLARAIRHASFERLQAQEGATGFSERWSSGSRFFRSGRVGQWKHALNDEQVARVVAAHRPEMRRLGYLPGLRD